MSPSRAPAIGERLRAERVRQGRSVRGLAREIGVSASLISQIETDKSQPSVSTLYAITTALEISIEDLFTPPDPALAPGDAGGEASQPETPAPLPLAATDASAAGTAEPLTSAPTADTRTRGTRLRALFSDRMRRVGPVVCPEHRERLTLDSGVVWELLGQVPGARVDFLRVTYEPGGASSSSGLLMRHSGTEYGYLTGGELTLTLGFDEYRLSAGDAISFESTTPHGYRNEGTEPAVGVWFVLERVD